MNTLWKKILSGVICVVVLLLVSFSFFCVLTNPYNSLSIVDNPFPTTIKNNQVIFGQTKSLINLSNPFVVFFGYYKSAFHILSSRYFGSQPIVSNSLDTIIHTIHQIRFDPTKPYLISGDQFSVYYPRNLGIFYSAALDPRIGFSKGDWENRERIYAQSVAYALEAFRSSHTLATTVVPVGTTATTQINIFTYPSDTLFSILYGLKTLQSSDGIVHTFPFTTQSTFTLQTKNIAELLLRKYKPTLHELMKDYMHFTYDNNTGLIKKSIHLSSARDSVIRQSAFYDNVVYWKTLTLGNQLDIMQTSPLFLDDLKKKIIRAFWNEKGSYFLNDLSGKNTYSSDWLIAISTGFLDPNDSLDRQYIMRSVAYIHSNKLDEPLPLRYQITLDKKSEFGWVKFFVPNYGNNAIWSHWGIEYIKTLLLLYQGTKEKSYSILAKKYLDLYTKNIIRYGGYPETYDTNGKFLQNFFYRSILINGWVINYEEAKSMLNFSEQER